MSAHETALARFIEELRALDVPGAFNPWRSAAADDAAGNGPGARIERLRAHMASPAKFILMGEGVGYQGGRCSGMAFTSERLMLEGAIPRIQAGARLSTRHVPWSEPAATVVWKNLAARGIADQTVLWNAFALHPHRAGEPLSNRAPSKAEMQLARPLLERVIELHRGAVVLAVGETSARAISGLGLAARKLRHPAFGGATQFGLDLADALAH